MVWWQFTMITVSHKQPDQGSPARTPEIESGERRAVYTGTVHWRARWYEWEDIIREAETNSALDDLLKKAEMIYALTK